MSMNITAALRAVSQCRTVAALDALAVELSVAEMSEHDFGAVSVAVDERRHTLAAISPDVQAALAAWREADPDGDATAICGAQRAVSTSGNGWQTYRRVVYPGAKSSVWVDCERLPALGGYAVEQRECASFGNVPVGSLVLDYHSTVRTFRKSRATLRIGLVTVDRQYNAERAAYGVEPIGDIVWLDHKRLRSRAVARVNLPDGEVVEIEVER